MSKSLIIYTVSILTVVGVWRWFYNYPPYEGARVDTDDCNLFGRVRACSAHVHFRRGFAADMTFPGYPPGMPPPEAHGGTHNAWLADVPACSSVNYTLRNPRNTPAEQAALDEALKATPLPLQSGRELVMGAPYEVDPTVTTCEQYPLYPWATWHRHRP